MLNILVIGDSHIKHFKNQKTKLIEYTVVRTGGASAQGLTNLNSKRKTLKKIQKFFNSNTKKFDYVILCFGEVDCNATMWYYKEKYNQTINQALERTLVNYRTFINTYILSRFNRQQIIIFNPILPTVSDNYPQTYEIRKLITATQKERTNLTDEFSNRLKIMADNNTWTLLSINNFIRNNNTGMIDESFIKNPLDHHLPKALSFKLWNSQLEDFIFDN